MKSHVYITRKFVYSGWCSQKPQIRMESSEIAPTDAGFAPSTALLKYKLRQQKRKFESVESKLRETEAVAEQTKKSTAEVIRDLTAKLQQERELKEQLDIEVRDLEQLNSELETETLDQKRHIDELNDRITTAAERETQLQAQIADVQRDLADAEKEVQFLLQKNEKIDSDRRSANLNVVQTTRSLAVATAELRGLKEKDIYLQNESSGLRTQIQGLESDLSLIKRQNTELVQAYREVNRQLLIEKGLVAALTSRLQQHAELAMSLTADIAGVNRSNTRPLQAVYDSLVRVKEDVEDAVQETTAAREPSYADISRLKAKVARLRAFEKRAKNSPPVIQVTNTIIGTPIEEVNALKAKIAEYEADTGDVIAEDASASVTAETQQKRVGAFKAVRNLIQKRKEALKTKKRVTPKEDIGRLYGKALGVAVDAYIDQYIEQRQKEFTEAFEPALEKEYGLVLKDIYSLLQIPELDGKGNIKKATIKSTTMVLGYAQPVLDEADIIYSFPRTETAKERYKTDRNPVYKLPGPSRASQMAQQNSSATNAADIEQRRRDDERRTAEARERTEKIGAILGVLSKDLTEEEAIEQRRKAEYDIRNAAASVDRLVQI